MLLYNIVEHLHKHSQHAYSSAMEHLHFIHPSCEINKVYKVPSDQFKDWAYDCVEWSDFGEDVPDLSEEHWERSEQTPSAGEDRTVFVYAPFDQSIGDEFWVLFEPALLFFNGYYDYPEDIGKCAAVRCRFIKVLSLSDCSAWIKVAVLEFVLLTDFYKYYNAVAADESIYEITQFSEFNTNTFQNDNWIIKDEYPDGPGTRKSWIYKDSNGIHHLVMQRESQTPFGLIKVSLGNIVNSPHT